MGFSNDECAQIYNTESKKALQCSPGHTDHCAISGAVNVDGTFAATSGTDGYLNIYSLSSDSAKLENRI